MEEGQLKKRISSLADGDSEIFPYSAIVEQLEKIIDEAKKEIFEGIVCDSEKYEAYHIFDEDKVINALLKWFGEVKKSE